MRVWEVAWDPNEARFSLCELRPCFSIISCGGAAVPYESLSSEQVSHSDRHHFVAEVLHQQLPNELIFGVSSGRAMGFIQKVSEM